MRVIESADSLLEQLGAARREAKAAFGRDEVFLEKLVRRARHVEVQILGDSAGKRGAPLRARLLHATAPPEGGGTGAGALPHRRAAPERSVQSAVRLGEAAGYECAGTVEYLMDVDSGAIYFIEVNPRIQVEHTVTEEIVGDRYRQGADPHCRRRACIGRPESGVPDQAEHPPQRSCPAVPHHHRGPAEQVHPRLWPHRRLPRRQRLRHPARRRHCLFRRGDHAVLRFPPGEGHRLGADGGRSRHARMDRALREFRIRGVATNLWFLEALVAHPAVSERRRHHALHRRDPGALRLQAPPRPGDAAAVLPR